MNGQPQLWQFRRKMESFVFAEISKLPLIHTWTWIYPFLKPSEVFACLMGGKKFTKLDLSSAYQQMMLDKESSKLATINTARGYFGMQGYHAFGVASALAVFQRTMDALLQGISQFLRMPWNVWDTRWVHVVSVAFSSHGGGAQSGPMNN